MTDEDETLDAPDPQPPPDPGDQVEAIASLLEDPDVKEAVGILADHDVPEWAVDIFLMCKEEGITVEQFQEAFG